MSHGEYAKEEKSAEGESRQQTEPTVEAKNRCAIEIYILLGNL